jgi:hypothetical protein
MMSRPVKICIVLFACLIWAVSSRALFSFMVADRCLDAGGALDAATGICIGAPWSTDPSIIASLPWTAWLFVGGLPGALVAAVVLVIFRILRKSTSDAA